MSSAVSQQKTDRPSMSTRAMDAIERVGNKIPHPFWLFLILALLVLMLSAVLGPLGISVDAPGEDEPVAIESLLTIENMRRIVVESISNFTSFPPLGIVLTVMLGVAVAEGSGLITAAVRLVVSRVSGRWLTFAIALTGVTGSLASDAIIVILPPLAAMAYLAVGRSPLLGIGVGFSAVGAGFNASLVINATDPLLAGISTSAAQIVQEDYVVSPLANIYFTVVSSIFLAALITLVAERYVAPRLEREEHDSPTGVTDDDQQDGGHDQHDEHDQASSSQGTDSDAQDSSPSDALANAESLDDLALDDTERRGIRNAAIAGAVFVLAFCGAVAIPGSPLRAADGTILTGPALLSVSIIIALLFVVVGVAYGKTVGTLSSWSDLPAWMTSGMKDLAPVLVLFFAAAQFIAWFSWSNMGTVLAVVASDTIESLGVPEVVLFLAIILMVYLLNLFITSGSAQWTLMAPVLVPAMMLLDVQPGVTQMLFRIGDSASNIITPLNVYFALMLTYLQRYRKDAGVGTLLSITLPVSVAILVGWTAFFLLWYAVGLPLGPGVPSR